jgi:hypothetical protein
VAKLVYIVFARSNLLLVAGENEERREWRGREGPAFYLQSDLTYLPLWARP